MFEIIITLPPALKEEELGYIAEGLSDISDNYTGGVDSDKNWTLTLYTPQSYTEKTVKSRLDILKETIALSAPIESDKISINLVPDQDWLVSSYQGFQPFTIGPFFIYGSHYEGTVPDGLQGLQIDASTAFGSGEHGTTKGCIQLMLDLKGQGVCPWHVLDMGTGSGILALAAYKLWKTPVTAFDNDPAAIKLAKRHREANKIPGPEKGGVHIESCNGFEEGPAQRRKPYDLIIANILAEPIITMAPSLTACADDASYVILSGMLAEQSGDVAAAYEKQGMRLQKEKTLDGWTSQLWHKS